MPTTTDPAPVAAGGYHPALGFLACNLAGMLLEYRFPLPGTPWPLPLRLAGTLPMLASLGLGGWGIATLRRARTPIEPGRVPACLVTGGPFRFSRNPLYLSQLLFLAGLGLLAFPWLLPIAVLQAVLLDRLVIPREERLLAACFGEAYGSYRQRVRRWL